MQRVLIFLAVLAVAVAGALTLISERAAATRTGYRVAELERHKRALAGQNQQLQAQVAKLKTAARISQMAKDLEVGAVPPEERLKQPEDAPEDKSRSKGR